MSMRYKGGRISATPPTTTSGSTGTGSASGVWSLEQQMQAQGSNTWPQGYNYVEDVFAAYLYTGTGVAQAITNGVVLNVPNEQSYTKAGTYTWVCPPGVTSVSVVCIGSGGGSTDVGSGSLLGGGGGGLGYKNNISVVPGVSYTVVVGTSGGTSRFSQSTTNIVGASGGTTGGSLAGGVPLYGSSGYAGGSGGQDNIGDYGGGGGGGGAGGFIGVGGNGGTRGGSGPTAGSGGGAGGSVDTGGQGMSPSGSVGSVGSGRIGGAYGGGGAGYQGSGGGADGAVRIIWPGTTRQFPNLNSLPQTPANIGGLVWTKSRSGIGNNVWVTSSPAVSPSFGVGTYLVSNDSNALATDATVIPAFSGDGYQIGTSTQVNTNGTTYVSWAFKQQPKFMDVVQFNTSIIYNEFGEPIGGGNATVSHNLQSTPGFIVIRRIGGSGWYCYHRSLGTGKFIYLGSTAAAVSTTVFSAVSSTQFSIVDLPYWGDTFEGWLFAHDAGGFGLTGTDNVISCGTYTGNDTTNNITLGYEPQFVIIKSTATTSNWQMVDTSRPMNLATVSYTYPNTNDFESSNTPTWINPTATGFTLTGSSNNYNGNGVTYIYIAIRRGPMKVPTSGATVFEPVTTVGGANEVRGTLFAADMGLFRMRAILSDWYVADRLRGISSYYNPTLYPNLANAEATPGTGNTVSASVAVVPGNNNLYFGGAGASTDKPLGYSFKRAPSFFDEVCYTGTGNAMTINHNLGVIPELMIVKGRSGATGWVVYTAPTGATKYMRLDNANAAATLTAVWNDTSPTSSVFTVGSNSSVNSASATYVAYLFATCPGVSKVGSYTGTGAAQTINCGFTTGARFVLIKRTDSANDWWVYDSARGISSLNDPYLLINQTASEGIETNYVDANASGFTLTVDAPAGLNASGGSYIFLAIA